MKIIKQLWLFPSLTLLGVISFYSTKAMSLFHYASWLIVSIFLLTVIILLTSKNVRSQVYKNYEKKSKTISTVGNIFEFASVLLMVWFGWYVLSTLHLILWILAKTLKDIVDSENKQA